MPEYHATQHRKHADDNDAAIMQESPNPQAAVTQLHAAPMRRLFDAAAVRADDDVIVRSLAGRHPAVRPPEIRHSCKRKLCLADSERGLEYPVNLRTPGLHGPAHTAATNTVSGRHSCLYRPEWALDTTPHQTVWVDTDGCDPIR